MRNQWIGTDCCFDLFSFILHKDLHTLTAIEYGRGLEFSILGFGVLFIFRD